MVFQFVEIADRLTSECEEGSQKEANGCAV